MHGPEHHVLDGACLLAAYRNAGGKIDLDAALAELASRGLKMPGAICAACGSLRLDDLRGRRLSIIEGTGPLTTDESWGRHLAASSQALLKMAEVGGPRCCKRDAYISLREGVRYVRDSLGIELGWHEPRCSFYQRNAQCLGRGAPSSPLPDPRADRTSQEKRPRGSVQRDRGGAAARAPRTNDASPTYA